MNSEPARVEELSDLLGDILGESRRRDLVGPAAIADQIAHSLGFVELIRRHPGSSEGEILDLGSGGGLPGLVLVVALPTARVTLLESAARRCRFLEWAVAELDVEQRVAVVHSSAETASHSAEFRTAFDVVTARSFGPPAVTAECARGLLRTGGHLIVSEPPNAEADRSRWDDRALGAIGFSPARQGVTSGASFAELEAVGDCPDSVPRLRGVRKRPLFS